MTKTKKLTAEGAASAIPAGNAFPTLDNQGNVTMVKTDIIPPPSLVDCILDGIFIMHHRKSDNFPLMVKPKRWASYQAYGEEADGVAIIEGGKILVIAPTESSTGLVWSSAAVNGGATMASNRKSAIADWNGETNTASIVSKSTSTIVTNTSSYAPGFCNQYSNKGLSAGKWWLPSVAEMMLILANKEKINYCLSLINGATLIEDSVYWTSTECTAETAYAIYPADMCLANWSKKISLSGRVRPVSAFIQ